MVGRESEHEKVCDFVAAAGSGGALLLTGEAGIGKTTLWEAGIVVARERGKRVLVARPSGAEAQLSFAALIDLCDGVEIAAPSGVPAPQRAALEVALLRSEPAGAAPGAHAIALGLLNTLRGLAVSEPVVIAIDDLQWLDRLLG